MYFVYVCVSSNVLCVTQRWLRLHVDEITNALSGKENVLLAQGTKEEHSLCEYTHTHACTHTNTHTKPMFVYCSVNVFSL